MRIEEPGAMKEIHDIRDKMFEETKNMTQNEVVEYIKAKAAEHELRTGIKLPKLSKRLKT